MRGSAATHLLPLLIMSFVLAAYCVWILRLPVFPSQDGPLHLYYANVLRCLLSKAPGPYAAQYRIGTYLPPYALYYYLLIALRTLVSFAVADKIVVCLSVLLSAFGFRYLARSVGPGGDWAALAILPILVDWPLMMGFSNYQFSLALCFWAMGLWVHFRARVDLGRRVTFAGLALLITIGHPVPLMLLGLLCGTLVSLDLPSLLKEGGLKQPVFWLDLACLAIFLPAGLYLHHFVIPQKGSPASPDLHRRLSDAVFNLGHGAGLLVFAPGDTAAAIYRYGVGLLFLSALALSGWHFFQRETPVAKVWFALSIAAMLMLPFLPPSLNGADFFQWRLVSIVFLAAALGTAGSLRTGRAWLLGHAGMSTAMSLYTLVLLATRVGPVAQAVSAVMRAPGQASGSVGVLMQAAPVPASYFLTTRPFLWAPMHYFREHQLLLYNTAWLKDAVQPLRRRDESVLDPVCVQSPPRIYKDGQSLAPGTEWNPKAARFVFLVALPSQSFGQGQTLQSVKRLMKEQFVSEQCDTWFCLLQRQQEP